MKTVAMIINYRICRLSFKLGCPVDAIASFRKHLDVYRVYKGPPELAYQHEAWLFRQHIIFGTIFEEAIQVYPKGKSFAAWVCLFNGSCYYLVV